MLTKYGVGYGESKIFSHWVTKHARVNFPLVILNILCIRLPTYYVPFLQRAYTNVVEMCEEGSDVLTDDRRISLESVGDLRYTKG